MNYRFFTLLLFSLIITTICFAQDKFKHTVTLEDVQETQDADIDQLLWITGHWTGEAFGGIVEEIWSAPLGGSMMAAFKLVVDDKVIFYEIETIMKDADGFVLKLKHFDAALNGWEEKDETVDFKFVKQTDDAIYFEGYTFKRINDEQMDVYVRIGEGDKVEELKFSYFRK